MQGRSSNGRTAVSKTDGWGFESLRPCQFSSLALAIRFVYTYYSLLDKRWHYLMQARWRKQQQQVLQALGITAYSLNKSSELSSDSSTCASFCYRIGPIYLQSTTPLPIETPRWLRDLCLIWDSQPVAVKAPASDAVVIGYEQLTQQLSSAAGKRQLWQQLQALG